MTVVGPSPAQAQGPTGYEECGASDALYWFGPTSVEDDAAAYGRLTLEPGERLSYKIIEIRKDLGAEVTRGSWNYRHGLSYASANGYPANAVDDQIMNTPFYWSGPNADPGVEPGYLMFADGAADAYARDRGEFVLGPSFADATEFVVEVGGIRGAFFDQPIATVAAYDFTAIGSSGSRRPLCVTQFDLPEPVDQFSCVSAEGGTFEGVFPVVGADGSKGTAGPLNFDVPVGHALRIGLEYANDSQLYPTGDWNGEAVLWQDYEAVPPFLPTGTVIATDRYRQGNFYWTRNTYLNTSDIILVNTSSTERVSVTLATTFASSRVPSSATTRPFGFTTVEPGTGIRTPVCPIGYQPTEPPGPPEPPDPNGPVYYVALGDSFSAGPSRGQEGACARSSDAWPWLLDPDIAGLDFETEMVACTGAVTKHIAGYESQFNDGEFANNPQLASISPIGDDIRLVTLTIGGNDAGYSKVISFCMKQDCDEDNINTYNGTDNLRVDDWIQELDRSVYTKSAAVDPFGDIYPYDFLLPEVRRKTPYARRILVGYPEVVYSLGSETYDDRPFVTNGLAPSERRLLTVKQNEVNRIMCRHAAKAGFEFVDMLSATRNRGAYAPQGGWINDLDLDLSQGGPEIWSFHPTNVGHQRIAAQVAASLARPEYPSCGNSSVTRSTWLMDLLERRRWSVPVDPGARGFSVSSQWPGSDFVITLTTPTGQVIDRFDTGGVAAVFRDVGPTYEQVTVDSPEPGEWIVEIFAADVAPEGEEVIVTTVVDGAPNAKPIASFTWSADEEMIRADATGSTDVDGEIVDFTWFVERSTGSGDEPEVIEALNYIVEGPKLDIESMDGLFKLVLMVTDDAGDAAFETQYVIPMDVRPDNDENVIVLRRNAQVPIAFYSSPEFDARDIDPLSLVGLAHTKNGGGHVEDVDGDGIDDLLVHISASDLELNEGQTEACLDGLLRDGTAFRSCAPVQIRPR